MDAAQHTWAFLIDILVLLIEHFERSERHSNKNTAFHQVNHLATEVGNNIIAELREEFRETMSMFSSNTHHTENNNTPLSNTSSLLQTANSAVSTNAMTYFKL